MPNNMNAEIKYSVSKIQQKVRNHNVVRVRVNLVNENQGNGEEMNQIVFHALYTGQDEAVHTL